MLNPIREGGNQYFLFLLEEIAKDFFSKIFLIFLHKNISSIFNNLFQNYFGLSIFSKIVHFYHLAILTTGPFVQLKK